MKIRPLKERFWEKVSRCSKKECWNWTAELNPGGYGRFYLNGKSTRAHRISWELCNGHILNDLHVLHKCDNKKCVNPNHLFLGTQRDNMEDKFLKNRQNKGETIGNSKLTEKEVLKIRELYSKGDISQRKLAKRFNVTQSLIKCITKRQIWKHI